MRRIHYIALVATLLLICSATSSDHYAQLSSTSWDGPAYAKLFQGQLNFLWPQPELPGFDNGNSASIFSVWWIWDDPLSRRKLPDGRMLYAWDYMRDAEDGFRARPGFGVPVTLFVLGLKPGGQIEYGPWHIIATQEHSIDSTKPYRFQGEVALNGNYEDVTVAVLYGVTQDIALDVALERPPYRFPAAEELFSPAWGYGGYHISQWDELNVISKDFSPLGGNSYSYSFTMRGTDWAGSPDSHAYGHWSYMVGLFDTQGWLVGFAHEETDEVLDRSEHTAQAGSILRLPRSTCGFFPG